MSLKKEETKVIWGHSGHPRRYRVLHITRGGIDIYLYCLRRQLQAAQLGEIDKRDQLHNWSVTGSCRAVSLSWWCRGSERWWSVNPTVSMVLRPQKPWGFLGTGRRGGGGGGGMEVVEEGDYIPGCYTVTTGMTVTSWLMWAATRAILMAIIVRDKVSHKTVSAQTTTFEEKGEPKRYRTEVLPLTSLTPYR